MIRATIKFNSDFHLGSGFGKANYIDSLFVKDSQSNPTITGQTLKGIIKDSCKRIANSFGIKCTDNRRCSPHCPVCQIFGKASYPGKYLFSPAYLRTTAQDKDYPIRRRTSIDRESGTAKEQALFSTEVATKDLEFEFTITPRPGNQFDEKEEILIIAGILWTREIGGHRRRGLGHCRITIQQPHIDKDDLKNRLKILEELKLEELKDV